MFGLARKGESAERGVLVDMPNRRDNAPQGGGGLPHEQTAQLEAFRQMVDSMPVNVMTLDLNDFTINYVNKTSLETLKTLEHLLPCRADQLLGQCFDIFHKVPSHQRVLVSDPENLPYQAHIELGDEILDLLISPIFDGNGRYVAPMLTWSVVTEKVKAAAAMQRLQTMVESMPVNVMTLDLNDFTINYLNKTSLETLKPLEHLLPCRADQLLGQCFDVFHKIPSHQRALVSDPENLPYQTNITLGDEILDLLVSPIFDADGRYVAPMLTWSVVTDKVKADEAIQRLTTMVDNMPVNVMMAEPEGLTITYINKTSTDTLKTLEHLLPVKAADMMGACIDIFHKHPEHQRQLLADPRNLPRNAKIKLGDETLDLRVSAIMDAQGNYLGPMVTWSVVTAFVNLADNFETDVRGVVETVTSAATEMQASAEAMSATAEETTHQSTAVAAASEEATTNVQTVAAAAEELSNSIQEIGRQVSESTKIAADAVSEARQTNNKVKGLAEAAQKIGDVVSLINDIAGQTNLLALNATIEAARAGDAGKGFAVVATEVKSLADQTAKATDEIASQIGEIQNATRDAVTAIESIGGTIDKVSDISTEIAQAIEQQNSATHEIAQNVQQAAAGTQEVSSNISGVTEAASETGRSAQQLLDAARELSQQSNALKDQAETFLVEVRAM